MTIYNNEAYIQEAIQSVLSLDYDSLEFILVDDGSTDQSIELVMSYTVKDSRIRLIRHDYNRGIAQATKTGIRHCTGDFILFAAADDVTLPNRARVCAEVFKRTPQYGLLVSRAAIIDENSRLTGESYGPPPYVHSGNISLHQLKRNYCLGDALVLRNDRKVLEQEHILELADDNQLSLEYILHGYQIGVIND